MDDDHDAAGRLIGGIGRHEQLQLALPDGFLRLKILRALERQDLVKRGVLREQILKAGRGVHRAREHL